MIVKNILVSNLVIAALLAPIGVAAGKSIMPPMQGYRFTTASPSLKAWHKRLIAKRQLTNKQMQTLADAGDRLAAFTYAKMLEQSDRADVGVSAIHYYAMATYLGQGAAIEPLTGLLRVNHQALSPKQLALAEQALLAAVRQQNPDAMLALAMFYRDGSPFGTNPAEETNLLRSAAHYGNNTAAFLLGAALSTGTRTPAEISEAKVLLTKASTGGVMMAQALLKELETRQ
jgi:TPR repeat protein